MSAVQSDNFSFLFGNVTFLVEKQDAEMYPGIETQTVTVDYRIVRNKTEAGICIKF